MDLFSLNIITCVVLAIISLAIFSVTLNEMNNKFDFKVSTCLMITFWGVVGIMTFFLIMAGIPFDNFKTTHQTQYTSFTVSGNGGTVIVTAREKNHHKKEKFIFNENLELMNHKWDEDSGKLTLSFNEEETDNPNSRGAKYNFYKINKELRYKKQDYCLIYQKVKVKHLNGFEWFFETYFNQEHLKKNLRTEVNITIQKGLMYNNQK